MRLKHLKTIAFLTMITLSASLFTSSCTNTSNKSNENDSISQEQVFEVDREFLNAYAGGNQIGADEKYMGKRFKVRGIIAEITNFYEPVVKVETEIGAVECVFSETDTKELANLSIAQTVVIDCVFRGILISARFEDCKIVK